MMRTIGGNGANDPHLLKFTKAGKFVMQIGHAGQSKGNADTQNLNQPTDTSVYAPAERQRRVRRTCARSRGARGWSPGSALRREAVKANDGGAVRSIKAIFWDNDGVLVDTEHVYFEATRQVLASAGIHLTREQYIELFLVQGRGAWHLAEEHGAAPADIDRLRTERNALYGEWLAREPRVADDIARVLDALHGKYVMGVVTSSRKDHFDVIHRDTGLLKYFDFVLTASDFSRVKPDPEPYLRAVERSGVAREACVAIEDSERGLASATGAGISCIVVPTALTRGGNFGAADRILGSIGEILAVL